MDTKNQSSSPRKKLSPKELAAKREKYKQAVLERIRLEQELDKLNKDIKISQSILEKARRLGLIK